MIFGARLPLEGSKEGFKYSKCTASVVKSTDVTQLDNPAAVQDAQMSLAAQQETTLRQAAELAKASPIADSI